MRSHLVPCLALTTLTTLTALTALAAAPSSGTPGKMRITEYMYSGQSGEFIEFTNLDVVPIDMSAWSFSDEAEVPGLVDLSAFGVVQPGESVLLIEGLAVSFRTEWVLPPTVKIIDLNTFNLGRNDAIHLYWNQTLVDALDYGDQEFPGSIRTQNVSGNPCNEAVGADDPYAWFLSGQGDAWGSYLSLTADLGNPGTYVAAVPCVTRDAGTPLCFGDGSGDACPCGNNAAPGSGSGCTNSSGAGAALDASGSSSVGAADLVLEVADAIPSQPGLFFQGLDEVNGGAGVVFGDGLRCCGNGVVRLQVVVPDANGAASTNLDIGDKGGVSAGDTRCYQYWYRNPGGSPCGSFFNLTNAFSVTWDA